MTIKTAIVVDDSKSARFALRRILEAQQIQVHALDNAQSCFDLLAQQKVDVVFLDHVMPGISGVDALKTLRADAATATLPVVLCTSHDEPSFLDEVRALGATDILGKPPSAAQLQDVLRHVQSAITAAKAEAVAATRAAEAAQVSKPMGQRMFAALRETITQVAPRDVSSEIKAQIESLRAQAERLQEQLDAVPEDAQDVTQLMARMDALERKVDKRLNELQAQIETGLRQQSERLLRITDAARSAAVESAQTEAHQTVMQAAGQISDQFIQTLIGALRGGSVKPLRTSTPAKTSPAETAGRPSV